VLDAAFWAFVGASSLFIGAVVGFRFNVPLKLVGLVMGFGAGTLISAVSFDLILDAAQAHPDGWSILFGMIAGSVLFWAGDIAIERFSSGEDPVVGPKVSGPSLVLGATLDGIPESIAIGLTLLGGAQVSVAIVFAVFLSNIPEAMAASIGLRHAGHSGMRVLWVWVGVVAMSTLSAAIGYRFLGGASIDTIAFIKSFAAGAVLTMLANTMMPEAYGHGGREVGLVTVIGFIVASALVTF
jgi:ZIP family zinc transporter